MKRPTIAEMAGASELWSRMYSAIEGLAVERDRVAGSALDGDDDDNEECGP